MNIYYIVAVKDIDDSTFYKYLLPSMTSDQSNNTFIIPNSEASSIFKKYNLGIKKIYNLQDDDILCFLHPDIRIHDKYFEQKIKKVFELRPDIGMVGVYGTTSFNENCGWWLNDRKMFGRGHILQGLPDSETFHMIDRIGFFDDIVSLDGCCLFVKGKVAKKVKFDDITFDDYHHYDCDYSFSVLKAGYKLAVADILVEHASEGSLPQSWYINKEKFLNKWKTLGYSFPININNFKEVLIKDDNKN